MRIYIVALLVVLLNIVSTPAHAAYTPSICEPVDEKVDNLPRFNLRLVEGQTRAAMPAAGHHRRGARASSPLVLPAGCRRSSTNACQHTRHRVSARATQDWFTVGASTVANHVRYFLSLCWQTADHHIGLSTISQRANTYTEVAAASFKELCMSRISKVTDLLTPTG